MDHFDWFLEQS